MRPYILLTVTVLALMHTRPVFMVKSKKSNDETPAVTTDNEERTASTSRDLTTHSRRLLKRMQKQNEQNSDMLAECYEQLGKYTRLLLVQANTEADNLTRYLGIDDRITGFKSYVMFMVQSELGFYLLGPIYRLGGGGYWISPITQTK